jgi:preprotein translocase subunit YajC
MGTENLLSAAGLWIVLIVLMYVLLIHPQRKKEKEHMNLVESLQVGDKVVTTGGIHGTVTRVEDAVVTLQVADNVRIKVSRVAISRRLEQDEGGEGGKR